MPIIKLNRLNKKQKQERIENLGKDGKQLADILHSIMDKFAKNQTDFAMLSLFKNIPTITEILKRNHYDTERIENMSPEQVGKNFLEILNNSDEVPESFKDKINKLIQ